MPDQPTALANALADRVRLREAIRRHKRAVEANEDQTDAYLRENQNAMAALELWAVLDEK